MYVCLKFNCAQTVSHSRCGRDVLKDVYVTDEQRNVVTLSSSFHSSIVTWPQMALSDKRMQFAINISLSSSCKFSPAS